LGCSSNVSGLAETFPKRPVGASHDLETYIAGGRLTSIREPAMRPIMIRFEVGFYEHRSDQKHEMPFTTFS
jgi:hypothetical protein